ncbi:MAG: hypothetical protein EB127_30265 [Alphaproteobacteria bacterium]|nr:hypothetical protein [Alphaproteobacteria bacterium]
MSILTHWLKGLFAKPKVTPIEPVLDYILTNRGVVLHIEQRDQDTYQCTKGSFQFRAGKKVWVRSKGSDLYTISSNNIESFLDAKVAEKLISQNIKK